VTAEPSPASRARLAALFVGALLVYGFTLPARDIWAEECFMALDQPPWKVLGSFLAMERWAGRLPLFFFARSFTIELFGAGAWGMRLPSLLFGAAAVPALYGVARRVLDERAAVLAAGGLGLLALAGYHARESLMYSLSVLVAVLVFDVGVDLARGRVPLVKAACATGLSLVTSLMLFPVAAGLGVGGVALGWGRDRRAALRLAASQLAVWALAGAFYGTALLRLRGRGGGLLSMGGEDGTGEAFTENDVLPALVRAVDGFVFGPNGPIFNTPLSVVLGVVAGAAVLALCVRRRGAWSVGALTVVGFLGGLAPFWVLSAAFGHDHRLDTRYFLHLAPGVLIAWVAALSALPRQLRGVGEALMLGALTWGTVRTQSPPNDGIEDLRETIHSRALAGDRAVGDEGFFEPGIVCLEPVEVPRPEAATAEFVEDRVWILRDKDEDDRFPMSMRRDIDPSLRDAGFDLAYEEFIRPELHEEFGQIVLVTRYDRGAERREAQEVELRVDLTEWPLTGAIERVRLVQLSEWPLRYRPSEWVEVGEVDAERDGDAWVARFRLDPETVYDWDVVPRGLWVPGVGEWPGPLAQVPFTVYALDAARPAILARPPIHLDPVVAVGALYAVIGWLVLTVAGVALSAVLALEGRGR